MNFDPDWDFVSLHKAMASAVVALDIHSNYAAAVNHRYSAILDQLYTKMID